MDATAAGAAAAMMDDDVGLFFFDAAAPPPLLPPARLPKSTAAAIVDDLLRFKGSLKWCAMDHSSRASRAVSYLAFLLFTVAVPIATAAAARAPAGAGLEMYRAAQLPESALAAIAFLTLSAFFRRPAGNGGGGLRHLLLLDGLRDDPPAVGHAYLCELYRTLKHLAVILLPCFAVELAHKIVFFSTVSVLLPGTSGDPRVTTAMFVAVVAAWVYRTLVFLFVCGLFRLTCELQILRLEEFRKRLEGGSGADAWDIFSEHGRIKKQLLVTSHRYRVFIVGCLVTISVSQLGGLMLVFAPKSEKNFFNSGDLVVLSVVQLSGFFMCLMGATRITHRAHRIVGIATRWHMLMTHASSFSNQSSDAQQLVGAFRTREALVSYLQHNKSGITLFGFILDRGLLQALFVFEMTLVLWILSKVIVI